MFDTDCSQFQLGYLKSNPNARNYLPSALVYRLDGRVLDKSAIGENQGRQ
jgi:hypothetical protein